MRDREPKPIEVVKNITVERFGVIMSQVCRADTAFSPDEWENKNPLLGHCTIVSLVAQDIFGETLLRASLADTPYASMKYHYINRLSNGQEKDFTAGQFGEEYPEGLIFEDRARAQALEHPDTMKRYMLFKERFWNSV